MSRQHDEELLRALRAEEDWALREMADAITPLIRHQLFDFEDWEDLRQHCLVQILRTLRRDEPVRNLWGLARKITICHVINHNRRIHRARRLFASGEEAVASARDERRAVDDAVAHASEVVYVLQRLERRCRRLFEKLFVQDRSVRDVAQELEITEGNLRVRLKRCRDRAAALRQEAVG